MNQAAKIKSDGAPVSNVALLICGIAQTLLFALICVMSYSFKPELPAVDRPLIPVLVLFGVAFLFYAWAWKTVGGFSTERFANHTCDQNSLLLVVVLGLVFRAVMLPSIPIQEVDIYRYIWDGGVVITGTDPYLYSPKSVLNAIDRKNSRDTIMMENSAAIPAEMQRVLNQLEQRPGLQDALRKTHYAQYTTPYPPVNQLVFGATVLLVPDNATLDVYLYAMKGSLLLFDIGTGFIIVLLLGHLGISRLLSLGYWWCPLTIKEFANSGHLDSIVIFFATLAIYLIVKAFWPIHSETKHGRRFSDINRPLAISGSIFLGVSIAAKIVPVVFVPIWFVVAMRRSFYTALGMLLVLGVTTLAFFWPMARHFESTGNLFERSNLQIPFARKLSEEPQGIEAFANSWEMNDFIFMLLVENFKPRLASGTDSHTPWFVMTSNTFRKNACDVEAARATTSKPARLPPSQPFFSIARKITLAIFAICVLGCCVSVFRVATAENSLEKAFLVIAWFWLFSPTQNPWYWIWTLPLMPLAKGRAWFWMSGILFLYYLRFWFEYHRPGIPVFGTPYSDTAFFDYVIPWIEFAPWLCLLFFCWLFRGLKSQQ